MRALAIEHEDADAESLGRPQDVSVRVESAWLTFAHMGKRRRIEVAVCWRVQRIRVFAASSPCRSSEPLERTGHGFGAELEGSSGDALVRGVDDLQDREVGR